MKFWDREKEIRELKSYIESNPNSILFVYGPRSSGKSTLLMKVAQILRDAPYRFLWYDLRGYAIERMEDAISIILGAKGVPSTLTRLFDIQLVFISIKTEELLKVFRKEKDPFVVLEEKLLEIREKGNVPIIVFDELQNLKDIYMNGDRRLVDRLFNFFVRLTKVQHLSHVVVMTSDTFFVEEVYRESSLENSSRFYSVDFFDDETAMKILKEEGLSEKEAKYIVSWIGGVPWMMMEIIERSRGEDVEKIVMDLYRSVKSSVKSKLESEYKVSKEMNAKEKEYLKLLSENGMTMSSDEEHREVVERLVELEILYYDPIKDRITPHTRLHERAIMEILST